MSRVPLDRWRCFRALSGRRFPRWHLPRCRHGYRCVTEAGPDGASEGEPEDPQISTAAPRGELLQRRTAHGKGSSSPSGFSSAEEEGGLLFLRNLLRPFYSPSAFPASSSFCCFSVCRSRHHLSRSGSSSANEGVADERIIRSSRRH